MKISGLNFGGLVKKTDTSAAPSSGQSTFASGAESSKPESGMRANIKSKLNPVNLFRSAKSRGSSKLEGVPTKMAQSKAQMASLNHGPSARFLAIAKKDGANFSQHVSLKMHNDTSLKNLVQRLDSLNGVDSSRQGMSMQSRMADIEKRLKTLRVFN
jgi:hypothetical protein